MKRFATFACAAALGFTTIACAQTDAGVTSKVKAQLAADDMVKAYKVDVDTRDHIVTLRGEVENEAVRQQAVRIARNTEGVTDVVDELRVVGTSGSLDPGGPAIDPGPVATEPTSGSVDRRQEKADDDGLLDNVKDGAKAAGSAIKKGAEATVDGAKKVGGKIVDAVTDDDRDSDNDGK